MERGKTYHIHKGERGMTEDFTTASTNTDKLSRFEFGTRFNGT